jgi:coatomer subunit beta'
MGRVWSISCLKNSNKVAVGYDDGTIMVKLGHEVRALRCMGMHQ